MKNAETNAKSQAAQESKIKAEIERINNDISILDESYDICQRKVLCMRASNETKKIRDEILSEARTKLKDIEFDRD